MWKRDLRVNQFWWYICVLFFRDTKYHASSNRCMGLSIYTRRLYGPLVKPLDVTRYFKVKNWWIWRFFEKCCIKKSRS